MATSLSLRVFMARMVSWALFSNGNTANSHQHQAGPLGFAWEKQDKTQLLVLFVLGSSDIDPLMTVHCD